jgi:hypothetical protein
MLLEDRCVQLLVKNLGRAMPESVIREELQSLKFRVQGLQLLPNDALGHCPTQIFHQKLHAAVLQEQ